MEPKLKHADTTVVILIIFTSLLPFVVQISSVQGFHMYQHHYVAVTSNTAEKKKSKHFTNFMWQALKSVFLQI